MGRLETRLVGAVVAVGILTAVSVIVADLGGSEPPEGSLAPASLPPESRTDAAAENETPLPAAPPCAPPGCQ